MSCCGDVKCQLRAVTVTHVIDASFRSHWFNLNLCFCMTSLLADDCPYKMPLLRLVIPKETSSRGTFPPSIFVLENPILQNPFL